MSITHCSKCAEFIDLDEEPEAYFLELPDGRTMALPAPYCLNCREKVSENYQEVEKDE